MARATPNAAYLAMLCRLDERGEVFAWDTDGEGDLPVLPSIDRTIETFQMTQPPRSFLKWLPQPR